MSGNLVSEAKTLLVLSRIAGIQFAVQFANNGLNLVSLPRGITLDGVTYLGTKDFGHPFAMEIQGIGTSLRWEVPGASIKITNGDGYFAGLFQADLFRREQVTVRPLYTVAGLAWLDSGAEFTFTGDVDNCDPNGGVVQVRLSSDDAVRGAGGPRRTTGEFGCQADYMGPGCGFRFVEGVSPTSHRTCPKTPEGCKERFGKVVDPITGERIQQPLPYGAFPGTVDSTFVRGQ